MKIKKDYVKRVNFHFEQVCKRAENLIDYYNHKLYDFTYKGYTQPVTVFGEAKLLLGNKDGDDTGILLKLLEIDKLSVEDYQLLSFYENCYEYAKELLEDLININDEIIIVHDCVFDALFHIENFEEGVVKIDKDYYLGRTIAK